MARNSKLAVALVFLLPLLLCSADKEVCDAVLGCSNQEEPSIAAFETTLLQTSMRINREQPPARQKATAEGLVESLLEKEPSSSALRDRAGELLVLMREAAAAASAADVTAGRTASSESNQASVLYTAMSKGFQGGMVLDSSQEASSTQVVWIVVLVALVAAAGLALYLCHEGSVSPGGLTLLEKQGDEAQMATTPTSPSRPPTSGAGPDTSAGPPALCPSLILRTTEARFLVSMDCLKKPNEVISSIDIRGTSGSKLMHAAIEDGPNRQPMLALFLVGCEHDPRAIMFASSPTLIEVYGRGGRVYGSLQVDPAGLKAVLSCEGVPVMTVDRAAGDAIQLTAACPNGRMLACGSYPPPSGVQGKNSGGSELSDAWGMKVKPGADAVLIISCMLSMLVLQPRAVKRLAAKMNEAAEKPTSN